MGNRTAQLVLEKIDTPKVEEVQALEVSIRESGGFGSIRGNEKNNTKLKRKWDVKMNELRKRKKKIKIRF